MIQQAIDFLRQHPEGVLAVTTHCARRTFVVNSLRLGIPAEVIMKWTGHSDFSAMKPYVAIVDKLKKENMAKYADLFEKEKKNLPNEKKLYFCT